MRIVVDTGVFYHPERLRELARRIRPVILPAVAYAERLRQLVARRKPVREFDHLLERFKMTVEPFGETEARRYVLSLPEQNWKPLVRDALIAAHVGERDQLWTTNPSDFRRLGIPADRLVEVPGGA